MRSVKYIGRRSSVAPTPSTINSRPLIAVHGANSRSALREAAAVGANAVECDVGFGAGEWRVEHSRVASGDAPTLERWLLWAREHRFKAIFMDVKEREVSIERLLSAIDLVLGDATHETRVVLMLGDAQDVQVVARRTGSVAWPPNAERVSVLVAQDDVAEALAALDAVGIDRRSGYFGNGTTWIMPEWAALRRSVRAAHLLGWPTVAWVFDDASAAAERIDRDGVDAVIVTLSAARQLVRVYAAEESSSSSAQDGQPSPIK